MGAERTNPIKKSHFIKVKILYLFVKGLITIRYPAYADAFKRKKEFPNGIFGAFIPVLLLFNIKKTAPENPIKIPIIFLIVTLSFKKNKIVSILKLEIV